MKKILMTICALTLGGALAVAQAGGAAGQSSSSTPQAGSTTDQTTTTQTHYHQPRSTRNTRSTKRPMPVRDASTPSRLRLHLHQSSNGI